MAVISFRNVTKTFPNGKTAVKDLSLEIRHGEFLVLTGPQGSGKVTLLRMIAGMEPISTGELWINGEKVENANPRKRNMGMVFRHYTLYPGMTVHENLAFPMRQRGLSEKEIREAVDRTVAVFRLEGLLSCYPRELTDIQKQYVAAARAYVHKPEAFLLVDVLGGLEPDMRRQARRRMKEIYNALDTTLIYVTEDPKEVMELGARTAVMRRGQLVQEGPVRELLERPRNLFVAQFMNSPRFALSEVRIVKGQTAVEAIGDGFSVDVPPEWVARLEQNGYIGHRVLMGYQTGEPAEDEDGTTERPLPDSRFYFFDRTTENTIL